MRRSTSSLTVVTTALLGGSLLHPAPAKAIVVRDDVPDAAYVVADADYPAIVTLFPPDDCSATLFESRHLLTVAHCAVDLSPGDALEVAGLTLQVDQVVLHPSWNDGDTHDIAVIRLDHPVTHVDPIPLHDGAVEVGETVVLLGRGTTGTGLQGERGGFSDGNLRRATNLVSFVEPLLFEVVFDAPQDPEVTDLEGVGASGDSGGPVLLERSGEMLLAGMNAFGDAPNGVGIAEYGAYDIQTRVAPFIDWIEEVVDAAPDDPEPEGGSSSGSASSSGGPPADGTTTGASTSGAATADSDAGRGGCRHGNGGSPLVALVALLGLRRRSKRRRSSLGHAP